MGPGETPTTLPGSLNMPSRTRLIHAVAALAAVLALAAPAAQASTTQQFVIQDDHALRVNLVATLTQMHDLGATIVKVTVPWSYVAPKPLSHTMPRHFNGGNPAAYPAVNWGFYDALVRVAKKIGIQVGFMLTSPAPLWATAPGAPRGTHYAYAWKPSAVQFGAFVKAVATRYDGSYKPAHQSTALPRVSWWSIWNEPNYGPDLAPQAIDNNTVYLGADLYRQLLAHAWSALAASGHTPKSDTILFGDTAPRGVIGKGYPGNFSGTVPVTFLQTLYCVDAGDRYLTGKAAAANGCPASASAFRAQNAALFSASGFAAHLYAQGVPPNIPTYQCGINKFCWSAKTKQSTPGYIDFAETARLTALLKRLAGHTLPIWNTEFGYWTSPPDSQSNPAERGKAVSPAVAALYMNWAEYLSYRNPNLASYSQYLLIDPVGYAFSTGLFLNNGAKLATYAAYKTPIFMPVTSASRAGSLEVWGDIRPASAVLAATKHMPEAQIQFQAGSRGPYRTVMTVKVTNPRGYFDVKVPFTRSGSVRVAWKWGRSTYSSREQAITVR
jgi:hypothetical protein